MLHAAVELLEEHGPSSMTTRKVTARVGTSSMAVYTDYGSIGGLVAAVVDHGFGLLARELEALPMTDDALGNAWLTARLVREFALGHRHLYAVMFAAESVAGYARSGEDLRQGVETLRFLHRICARLVDEGIFTLADSRAATRRFWVTMHGHLMLELAGYAEPEVEPLTSYGDSVSTLMIGLGADPEVARASVTA